MKLYEAMNGYTGCSYVRCLVVAADDAEARRLAAPKFRDPIPEHEVQLTLVRSDVTRPWASVATDEGLVDDPETVLDLLQLGLVEDAVDMVERLQRTVTLRVGDLVPYGRLPLMRRGQDTDLFRQAWFDARDAVPNPIKARMNALREWLGRLFVARWEW